MVAAKLIGIPFAPLVLWLALAMLLVRAGSFALPWAHLAGGAARSARGFAP
jgi:hypothetical protein